MRMKNQYFGDINDYRKYGLLRALQSTGDGKLLVAWMLTPDDSSQDGEFRSYLEAPDNWAEHDRELFEGLADLLRQVGTPAVSLMEGSGLLPGATYHSATVPDGRQERADWRRNLLNSASGIDLVFLDPDNGIEVASKPVGHRGSSKYVMWQEIEELWDAGCSLLIYQHYAREKRDEFVRRLVAELRTRTGAYFTEAFQTPHVVFLSAAQDRDVRRFEGVVPLVSRRWKGQIDAMGLADKRGTRLSTAS